jgi:prepilin peptidase CpaA
MTQIELLRLDGTSVLIRYGVLVMMVTIAAIYDIQFRRIPNLLVLTGLVFSLIIHVTFNEFYGFKEWGYGMLTGFVLFLPFYVLHAMGAGDVKLMAMAGSFLDAGSAIGVVLTTLVVGGGLSIVVAFHNGVLRKAISNVHTHLTQFMFKKLSGGNAQLEQLPSSAGNLPYAVAIAIGTLIHVILLTQGRPIFS